MISAKHFLLISTLLLLSIDLFSQVTADSTAEKNYVIKMVHPQKETSNREIKSWDNVVIRQYGSDKKIKGHLIPINDSTITINDQEILLDSIESIKVSKPSVIVLGAILGSGGVAGIVIGSYLVITAKDYGGFFSQVIQLAVGGALTVTSIVVGFVSAGVLSLANKNYNMEIWEFNVKSVN